MTLRDFKDISGVVRKQEPQHGLILNLFDAHHHKHADAGFGDRIQQMVVLMQHMQHEAFRVIPQFLCGSAAHAAMVEQALLERFPTCEGLIWRDADAVFKPGTRRWDYQKLLNEPTVDLRIIGFEEAKCGKTGAGKGMVGRLIADYKGTEIGVGPGKLTHKERKELWSAYQSALASSHAQEALTPLWKIAQIKYKKDDSYDALRQPTFQHWRPEKTEPSHE
jgi:ATP-dependent DNA ligase